MDEGGWQGGRGGGEEEVEVEVERLDRASETKKPHRKNAPVVSKVDRLEAQRGKGLYGKGIAGLAAEAERFLVEAYVGRWEDVCRLCAHVEAEKCFVKRLHALPFPPDYVCISTYAIVSELQPELQIKAGAVSGENSQQSGQRWRDVEG
ncbi:unnamed protein product, partial [Pleuronectes platessa]